MPYVQQHPFGSFAFFCLVFIFGTETFFSSPLSFALLLCHNFFNLLHQNLWNCSSASNTDSILATSRAKFKRWTQLEHCAMERKCFKHFYILHLYESVLFSSLNCLDNSSYSSHPKHPPDNGPGLCNNCEIHELCHQSIFVLLAYSWTQNSSL